MRFTQPLEIVNPEKFAQGTEQLCNLHNKSVDMRNGINIHVNFHFSKYSTARHASPKIQLLHLFSLLH